MKSVGRGRGSMGYSKILGLSWGIKRGRKFKKLMILSSVSIVPELKTNDVEQSNNYIRL